MPRGKQKSNQETGLKKGFADFKNEFTNLTSEFANLKNEAAHLKSEFTAFKNEFAVFRSEVATNFDRVFREFEAMREDRIFALAKDRELAQQIEHLDKRVTILESSRA